MPSKKYLPVIVGGIAVLLLVIFAAVKLGGSGSDARVESQALVSSGVSYLESLEAKDPAQVDTVLKQLRQQKLLELREERLNQLESGEISVWSLFEDYVLLGDSRAVGFSFYGYLPEDRVLAESGATIRRLKELVPDVVALNPSNIFLCYGLNDVSIGIWPTTEDYVAEFSETIAEIQAQLPEVQIYISSILPARDPAFQTSTAWYDIPEYSQAVKTMCDSIQNCHYVDNDTICEEYADLWEVDGIHVQRDFYPHWAANLITEVYSSGLEAQYGLTDTGDTASSGQES